MRNLVLVLVMLTFVSKKPSYAQDLQYPSLVKVQIHATIMYDVDHNMFQYDYALANDAANTGSIVEFEVDISRDEQSANLDTVGLRFENDSFTEGSFRRNFPHLQARIVPVGFLRTPDGTWTGRLSDDLTASFGGTRSYVIRPGKRSDAFEMMSKGLPSIRWCIVSPFFNFDSLFSEQRFPNEEDIPNTDSIQNAVKYRSWTIGPMAPPAHFDALAWIDTLLSYSRQSTDLGWLGKGHDNDCDDDERPDDGIVKNIELRLEKAKRELTKGDSVQTRKELEKLVQKVERIWKRSQEEEKKHKRDQRERNENVIVTSEAYALLKYNTEYLIERLPAKSKNEKDDKDKKPKK